MTQAQYSSPHHVLCDEELNFSYPRVPGRVAHRDTCASIPTAHEKASQFLLLPAEIRLNIYSHILPTSHLPVSICKSMTTMTSVKASEQNKSTIQGWFKRTIRFSEMIRENGLHLLIVCKRIREEVLSDLESLPVVFHCCECLRIFMSMMSKDTTIGVRWMRLLQVEVHIDAFKDCVRTKHTIRLIRHEAFKALKKIKSLYAQYGTSELAGKVKWTIADIRPKWPVDIDPSREHPFLIEPILHSIKEVGDFWLVAARLDL